MAVNSLSVMSPDGGLSRYLTEIRKFPMLPKDEEFMLAQRWKEHQDPQAAHKMVTSRRATFWDCKSENERSFSLS